MHKNFWLFVDIIKKKKNKENKEKIQKHSRERDIKNLLKKNKTKSENMVVNNIRIPHKTGNKGYLSIEKDIMKCKEITARLLSKVPGF